MSQVATKKKTAIVQIRIEEEDKKKLEKTLHKLGLTLSQAGLMYFKQILLKKRIPLDISLKDDLDYSEISPNQFNKIQAELVKKMDKGEEIPHFTEKNARKFEW